MDGALSQEEINALLSQAGAGASQPSSTLTDEEKDAIGEIANISMGTAATTLFSLVNRRVEISTPVVEFATWDDIVQEYERPCVFIRIAYTLGLNGSNLLVLKESDVKIITDLMMGGDGTNTDAELGELHLSAISEAMNQMMGSSATSLSSMLNKAIDISPPKADIVDVKETVDESSIEAFLAGEFVKISFRMEIGDLVDSEIMQLYPIEFAKEMCVGVSSNMEKEMMDLKEEEKKSAPAPAASAPQPQPQAQEMPQAAAPQAMDPNAAYGQPQMGYGMPPMGYGMPPMGYGMPQMGGPMMGQPPVNVQPAQFQSFNQNVTTNYQPENIDLILDVPLEVTVELGRASKSISDILDFGPGKIIELNKLAGDPVDVLVNGKFVAKGEVVVIEENFGVRISEIIAQPRSILS